MTRKKRINEKIHIGNMYNWGGKFGDPTTVEGAAAGSIGSAVGSVANDAIGGEMTDNTGGKVGAGITKVGGKIGDAISTVNSLIGGIVSAASGIIGGLTTRASGADLNEEKIADIENLNAQMEKTMVAGGSNSDILSQWSDQVWGDNFNKGDIGKDGWFSDTVGDKYNKLKNEQEIARKHVFASYDNAIENTEKGSTLNMLANYSAQGGPIHIAPSKRGTFTAAASRHNMGVQEFARKVLANKEDYSTSMVRKANFARNAAGWKHAEGGFLTHGGIFDNGLIFINNGGTHENNPMEGIQMGVDPQGVPNLVEENEVIWNDYVFSDRLKTNKEIRSKYKMRKSKEMSFADMAKKLSKESEERPYDPISKRGLEANLVQLAMEQEKIRMKKEGKNKKNNKFLYGGPYDDYWWAEDTADNTLPSNNKAALAEAVATPDTSSPTVSNTTNGNNTTKSSSKPFLENLRYAQLGNNALGVMQNLLSKPDYSAVNRLNRAAANISAPPRVGYTPLGDYMKYTPVDINLMTNKLAAESARLRNALLNSSSPSRNAALLAANYNAQNALGDAYIKATEQDLARKQAVATFNRGTNQANAEMGLKASMANAELAQKAKQLGLSATMSAINLRNSIDEARNKALNTNLNNLFTGLSNIGKEAYMKKLVSTGDYAWDGDKIVYIGK